MPSLTIRADRANSEADLVFEPDTDSREILDNLHNVVLPQIDGASMKSGIDDSVVAIRKIDFDAVVTRLADHYRTPEFPVHVKNV
jgi:hypothetical protein